jgi:hypothetical protein
VTWLALIRGIFMGWRRPPPRPGPHVNTGWVPVSEVMRATGTYRMRWVLMGRSSALPCLGRLDHVEWDGLNVVAAERRQTEKYLLQGYKRVIRRTIDNRC